MEKRKKSNIGSTLFTLILLIVVFGFIYPRFSFGYFMKSVRENDTSSFSRDHEIKYSEQASYKIENENYSDALFYQTVSVIPNTTYRVSCMVKTENVENFENTKTGGAQIAIAGTSEKSENVYGTQDWKRIELLFNSKNREEVNIAFRLGGYNDESKGVAYFSDFKMEQGAQDYDNSWHFACFVFERIDATYEEDGEIKHTKATMTQRNREDIYDDMSRLKRTIREFSKGKMEITYDILTISDPVASLTYDEENGYYIDVYDVLESIQPYLEKTEYDHLFLASPFGDINMSEETGLPLWVGLGGMDYNGIGYSNVRLSQAENDYTLRYDTRINTFPEEVFLHEFLHTLERNAKEYGYEVPALHDYRQYGYEDQSYIGLKDWYEAYMQGEILEEDGTKVGLPEQVYSSKPAQPSNFQVATEVEGIKETTNIFEEVLSIIERTKYIFNQINHQEIEQTVIGEA